MRSEMNTVALFNTSFLPGAGRGHRELEFAAESPCTTPVKPTSWADSGGSILSPVQYTVPPKYPMPAWNAR